MLDLAVLEQMANADAYARLRLGIGLYGWQNAHNACPSDQKRARTPSRVWPGSPHRPNEGRRAEGHKMVSRWDTARTAQNGTRRRIWSVNLATKQIYIEALNVPKERQMSMSDPVITDPATATTPPALPAPQPSVPPTAPPAPQPSVLPTAPPAPPPPSVPPTAPPAPSQPSAPPTAPPAPQPPFVPLVSPPDPASSSAPQASQPPLDQPPATPPGNPVCPRRDLRGRDFDFGNELIDPALLGAENEK